MDTSNLAFHLTARLVPGIPALCGPQCGPWMWDALRKAFPDVLAACLMPDHPHLIPAGQDPREAEMRLNRLLGHFARRIGVPSSIGRAAPAQPLTDPAKVKRSIRYVALNPCRAGHEGDPSAWVYSTHRDVLGAVVDPWVTDTKLMEFFEDQRPRFRERYHRYVSADPSAHVDGTPYPRAAEPTRLVRHTLLDIASAAASANRTAPAALGRSGPTRKTFVLLAVDQGWVSSRQLADVCDCAVQTIRRLRSNVDPSLLEPARLCLGDDRLRKYEETRWASGRRR